MVESTSLKQITTTSPEEEAKSFPHKYELPRHIEDEKERRVSAKMIKTIDNIQASGAFKDKIKMLYV